MKLVPQTVKLLISMSKLNSLDHEFEGPHKQKSRIKLFSRFSRISLNLSGCRIWNFTPWGLKVLGKC